MATGTGDARPRSRWSSAWKTTLPAVLAIGLVSGCAGPTARPDAPEASAYDPGEMARIGQSPLADFSIDEDDIPGVLRRAVADPYAMPVPSDCATIAAEVLQLDAALGSDFDVVRATDRPDDYMSEALIGAVRGLIPYRGVIGLLTGARQRARRVAEAVAAGTTRRGYLKGPGESIGCDFPAAPKRALPEAP